MATDAEVRRGARVFPIPPPMYYAAGLVAGALLDTAAPLPLGGRPATTVAGLAVIALGAVLAASAVAAVVRHRTTIVPHRRVATLLTEGPYRLSRNPMYAGLAVVYTGVALLIGSWWPLILLPLALTAVQLIAIRPEERYLATRFPTEYAAYRARVRRWL
ncbi:isoprenylcysteine carboxylmethyltransferase family protein [Dactylosporangium vinaceum]|uniref:Methyltransferase family protein n=1 Tax=Dactylosporangium vinaceum TaxID=53362 RepID=A0ABV5MCR7_9ACTN|nr:isoprenylcysteine carboxylmethyltransferase family protein [Dactylosporangium vinaceum]